MAYSYDAAGNLTQMAAGQNVYYSYDALNRLATVYEANTGTTSYAYDAVGNLTSVAYPNGVVHAYSYDQRNRLANLAVNKVAGTPAVSTPLLSYAYTLDASGHRTVDVGEHLWGERSETVDWSGIGQSVRNLVLGFVEAFPEDASKLGNPNAAAQRAIEGIVGRHFGFPDRSGNFQLQEDKARACALGNPAACN